MKSFSTSTHGPLPRVWPKLALLLHWSLWSLLGLLPAAQAQQSMPMPASAPAQAVASQAIVIPAVAPPQATAAPAKPSPGAPHQPAAAAMAGDGKDLQLQLREALKTGDPRNKRINLLIDAQSAGAGGAAGKPVPYNPLDHTARQRTPSLMLRVRNSPAIAARTAPIKQPAQESAPATPKEVDVPWSYAGEGRPERWAQLKPEYSLCGNGLRQSPIAIEDADTLKGPAEALAFHYSPSNGVVTNNGHTIEVQVTGDNSMTVRGASYQLVQMHFHHPAEERINGRSYPMVAHLMHRSDTGQLVMVAVLLEVGELNPLIQKVWTYMPLDVNDSVHMPPKLLHLGELLPGDLRYYQYMGSLTTPPCAEGVLWLILKQPVSISREQLRLFAQLYANNARPVQARHGRAVRDAVLLSSDAKP